LSHPVYTFKTTQNRSVLQLRQKYVYYGIYNLRDCEVIEVKWTEPSW